MPAMRDFYVLVIGVVLGVALGPAGLGQYAPSAYDALFGSVRDDVAAIEQFDRETDTNLNRLIDTGVTKTEVVRFGQQREMERGVLVAALRGNESQRLDQTVGRVNAIVLVMIGLVMMESFLPIKRTAARTGQAALLAVWLALVIANPALLRGVSWWFVGGLLIVVAAGVIVKSQKLKVES